MGTDSLVTTQQQYEELKPKLLKAMEIMDSPDRLPGEVEAWFPRYKKMFDEATRLERMIRSENERPTI